MDMTGCKGDFGQKIKFSLEVALLNCLDIVFIRVCF